MALQVVVIPSAQWVKHKAVGRKNMSRVRCGEKRQWCESKLLQSLKMWKFAKATLHTQRIYENMVLISSHYSTCCLRLSWSPLGVLRRLGVFLSLKRIPKRRTKVFFGFPKFALHFFWCFTFCSYAFFSVVSSMILLYLTKTVTVAFTLPCSCLTHATLPLSPATVSRHRGACALVNVVPLPRLVLFWRREQWGWITMCLQDWMDAQEKKSKQDTNKIQFSSWSPMKAHCPMNLDFGNLFFCSHPFRDFGWLPGHVGICCRTYASEAELNLTKFLMSRYIVGECVFCPNLLDIFLYNFLNIFC